MALNDTDTPQQKKNYINNYLRNLVQKPNSITSIFYRKKFVVKTLFLISICSMKLTSGGSRCYRYFRGKWLNSGYRIFA
jgi:hypothetical protein